MRSVVLSSSEDLDVVLLSFSVEDFLSWEVLRLECSPERRGLGAREAWFGQSEEATDFILPSTAHSEYSDSLSR